MMMNKPNPFPLVADFPTTDPTDPISGATFDRTRLYRWALWRSWDRRRPAVAFIGLNPSTADELVDDPTVRRCIAFAAAWGFGTLYMLNAFAWRSTDPRAMKAVDDPVGRENDAALRFYASRSKRVVAAWGVHGGHRERDRDVLKMLRSVDVVVESLGTTLENFPRHPLYLASDLVPYPYAGRDPECRKCGYRFDVAALGKYGCPNCHGDGLPIDHTTTCPVNANAAAICTCSRSAGEIARPGDGGLGR